MNIGNDSMSQVRKTLNGFFLGIGIYTGAMLLIGLLIFHDKLSYGLGLLFGSLVAVLVMIYVLVEKFTVGTPILGWASLMCVVLFSFGIMMLMMGILGEYVWRALDASRNRPPFLIDEIKKSGDE